MDLGLHTGRVQSQFPTFRHFDLDCQLHHAIVQRAQGLRAQGVRPPNERRLSGHTLEIHPAEPAQRQAVGDPFGRLFITPVVQVLEQQQTQNHFHGCGVPSMRQRQPILCVQIGAYEVGHFNGARKKCRDPKQAWTGAAPGRT